MAAPLNIPAFSRGNRAIPLDDQRRAATPKRSSDASLIPHTVREGARTRTVSKLEGIILRQVEAALKGDAKAALAALRMMAQVGLLDPKEITEDGPQLSATERAIVDEMFEKHSTRRRQK
jgi:hypothetical protein